MSARWDFLGLLAPTSGASSNTCHAPSARTTESSSGCIEDYIAFIENPSRVLRLEWRKARRTEHRGFTSHSWLEACLLDGQRLRLEFFSDKGFCETLLLCNAPADPNSGIYDDRIANEQDFNLPLVAETLRCVAQRVGKREYSLVESNCHHFVLDVWNAVVIEALQQNHYPDRMKAGVLGGVMATLERVFSSEIGTSLVSNDLGVRQDDLAVLQEPSPNARSQSEQSARPNYILARTNNNSARQEEGDRISGELVAESTRSIGYDVDARVASFLNAVATGIVFRLGLGTALSPVSNSGDDSFASTWLLGLDDLLAFRLACRVGTTDVVELVAQVLQPSMRTHGPLADSSSGRAASSEGQVQRKPALGLGNMFSSFSSASSFSTSLASRVGLDRGLAATSTSIFASSFDSFSLAALESVAAPGNGAENLVEDVCYVVLRSASEVRLAIYAVLNLEPTNAEGRPSAAQRWRLRMLSGDARAGEEATFAYTMRGLAASASAEKAQDFAREEQGSLQIALSTNDWGFVTLS